MEPLIAHELLEDPRITVPQINVVFGDLADEGADVCVMAELLKLGLTLSILSRPNLYGVPNQPCGPRQLADQLPADAG